MAQDLSPEARRLEQLRSEVEGLWSRIINTALEQDKQPLRLQYREAFARYKIQVERVMEERERLAEEQAREDSGPPDVFHYQEYRQFLLDRFRYLKTRKQTSVESVAGSAGLGIEEMSEVFKGARSMSRAELAALMPHLGLTPVQEEFLESLRSLVDARTAQERIEAARRIQDTAAFRKSNPDITEAWQYLSHWYYVVIREMSTLGGFKARTDWVRSRLRGKVTTGEVDEALTFLEKAGFFKKRPDGHVDPMLREVECVGGVYRAALGRFHQEMLSKAGEALLQVPSDRRWISGRTFAVSADSYPEVVRILSEALDRISEIPAGETSRDDVYHIGLFAVPLSRGDE